MQKKRVSSFLANQNNSVRLLKLRYIPNIIIVSIRRLFGLSDVRRWSNYNNLSPDWEPRTACIATLIPANSKVLEFGSGRMTLVRYLPANCSYVPSDIVHRGPGTLICDLNARDLPVFPKVDVVVFSGVLEYINDVPRVVSRLSTSCTTIIASYSLATKKSVFSVMTRRMFGWVNSYSEDEFIRIFGQNGFALAEKTFFREQSVFKFKLSQAYA